MKRVESRAVKIAARILVVAGCCRYKNPTRSCRRLYPTEEDCDLCVEKWLLAKARAELRAEEKHNAD